MHYFLGLLKILIILKLLVLAVTALVLFRPLTRGWGRNPQA
jgi:hypothetical protein